MATLVIATFALAPLVHPSEMAGWPGLGAVVLVILEALLLPVFVLPVWVAIVSVVLFPPGPSSLLAIGAAYDCAGAEVVFDAS